MSVSLTFLDETIERIGREPDALIPILQAVQDHYGYLPEEALSRIGQTTRITPASITGVATFYDMFRRQPSGKHIVRVCRGTACHVSGAELVEEALRRQLRIPAGADTDRDRQFTIEPVACLGCCTLAPVLKIGQSTFGHSTAEKLPGVIRDFLAGQKDSVAVTEEACRVTEALPQINIGLGSCCMAKGSDRLFEALQRSVKQTGAQVCVKRVGCVGVCHRTPLVEVVVPGKSSTFYSGLNATQAQAVVLRHFRPHGLVRRLRQAWARALDNMLDERPEEKIADCEVDMRQPALSAFLGKQVRIATENFGKVDPLDLDEYIAHGGFEALARCLGCSADSQSTIQRTSDPGSTERDEPFSLCLRERAGVRGNCALPAPAPSGSGDTDPTTDTSAPGPLHRSDGSPLSPHQLISLIEQSGLRGRGGAGFPTGPKWRLARQEPGEVKYVICNGDEGDPGAFMDRMLLESFPYRIIEGLAIAAVAVGAHEGIFYIRHEYPLAVKRVRAAIELCQQRAWLGERLLGSDYQLRLTIKEGAGAFVCGEETALIASLEGQRGMPRLRPPFPVEAGLCGRPTAINNVETLAVVPWIVRHGPEAFAAHGTKTSKGTKVFALAGKVQRGGLIEVPMGTTIREIVEEIGGGAEAGRRFKAVQIGGPSGGCLPARLAETPIDYESLREAGAIMGSGGLIVLDDSACMVDIARYFLQFTQNQSCGKCTFCRIGTRRMLDLLDRLCAGKGQPHDLSELERLAHQVSAGSLCGLGKTAPNPVLTTLRYFRDEYEAHLLGRCPAGKCTALIQYRVLDHCTGCTICAQHCPADAIPMTPYRKHNINLSRCTRCDSCRQVCPEQAVAIVGERAEASL